jgi:hypothetical protein
MSDRELTKVSHLCLLHRSINKVGEVPRHGYACNFPFGHVREIKEGLGARACDVEEAPEPFRVERRDGNINPSS